MRLEAGSIVADRFRLVRPLGGGGMGEVWAAHDTRLDMPCAVKFLRGATLDAPEARARFEREAKAAAHLRSPHVVQILDHGESLGAPYIAMELLEGEDLANRLRRVHRIGLEETAAIVAQIAKALTRAQSLSLIHRDLKPANVFLVRDDPGEIVKVLDFGIAKSTAVDAPPSARTGSVAPAAKGMTQAGVLMGTPTYMSPEQISGEPVDARADLWSLAMLAFECLTGEPPFISDNIGELFLKIQTAPLPRLSERVPELPPALDVWFAQAAARSPSERFQTARALSDALDAAAGLGPREGARSGSTSLHPSGRNLIAFEATQPTLEPVATDGGPPSSAVSPTGSTRAIGVTEWMIGAPGRARIAKGGVRRFVVIGGAVIVAAGGIGIAVWVARHNESRATASAAFSPASASSPVSASASKAAAPVPAAPGNRSERGRIVQIGAGDTQTCVRWAGGSISCWGAWSSDASTPPKELPDVTDAIDLAVSGGSICFVHEAGTVTCLGRLARYQSDLDALSDVRNVAIGSGAVCTIAKEGGVHCFGDAGIRHTDAGDVPLLAESKQIVLGDAHGCALGPRGRVSCWGDNNNGQLARDGVRSSDEPLAIGGATDVVELVAGSSHTCGRRADGRLVCWGSTEAYIRRPKVESGSPGIDVETVYDEVAPVPGVYSVVAFAAGHRATCAVEHGGRTFCFGENSFGQLGDGTTEATWPDMKVRPVATDGMLVAMGRMHSCAVVAAAEVRCWGVGDKGELGFEGVAQVPGRPRMAPTPGRVQGL